MPITYSREPPCQRCYVPNVDMAWSYCQCRSELADANATNNLRLPTARTKISSKHRQEWREVYAARLQRLRQEQFAAQDALATKQREWIESQAQIKRDYEIAQAELQHKIESCEESFRLRKEQILASGRFEVRSTMTQQSAESKRSEKQIRARLCESSDSTMETTKTNLQSGQDNQTTTTSGVGAGVDSIEKPAGESTSDRAFAGVSRDDADSKSTLGETTCRRWEAATEIAVSTHLYTHTNVVETRNTISCSVSFANETATKINGEESCLQVAVGKQKVEFDGLVSSKKCGHDQLMSVNRESEKLNLSWPQEQRSIPERALLDLDAQHSPGPRNQLLPLLHETESQRVDCSMMQRYLPNRDHPLFISTFINIGRWYGYSGAEQKKVWEKKLIRRPEQDEHRTSSSMSKQREGMCGLSTTSHEQLDKLIVLEIVLPNPYNYLDTVMQPILLRNPCLFKKRWKIDRTDWIVHRLEVTSRWEYSSERVTGDEGGAKLTHLSSPFPVFIVHTDLYDVNLNEWHSQLMNVSDSVTGPGTHGLFDGVQHRRVKHTLTLNRHEKDKEKGFSTATNHQCIRKPLADEKAFVKPVVLQGMMRSWSHYDSGKKQVGVHVCAVAHASAMIGVQGDGLEQTALGYKLNQGWKSTWLQFQFQWFQIDPGGKALGKARDEAYSTDAEEIQLAGEHSVPSAARTRMVTMD